MKYSFDYKTQIKALREELIQSIQARTADAKVDLPDEPIYNGDGGIINEVISSVNSTQAFIRNNQDTFVQVSLNTLGTELLLEVLENLEQA